MTSESGIIAKSSASVVAQYMQIELWVWKRVIPKQSLNCDNHLPNNGRVTFLYRANINKICLKYHCSNGRNYKQNGTHCFCFSPNSINWFRYYFGSWEFVESKWKIYFVAKSFHLNRVKCVLTNSHLNDFMAWIISLLILRINIY